MAQVTVRINGYSYTVGCENGQEAHLQAMVEQVERRIAGIKSLGGQQSSEARTLVLASLLMADELHDMAQAHAAGPGAPPAGGAAQAGAAIEPEAVERLRLLADRAEEIATGLERA